MNWQAVSFDWNQVRAFYAAYEEGSFSGAARVLNATQPTVGRQIAALEESLGVTLVERSVKGLQITETGIDLIEYVRAMTDAAAMISMIADSRSQDLTGEVAVAASDLMSSSMLPTILAPLRQSAPGISLRFVASNDIQDLIAREADIAIRHIRPEQPELIARYIGDFGANLYASKSYLDTYGRPASFEDISEHVFIANAPKEHLIAQLRNQGIAVHPDQFASLSQNGSVAWELVRAGYGIAMQPDRLGGQDPQVEKVFPSLPSQNFPVWLVTHRELRTSPRIRAVFDTLAQGLREIERT